MKYKVGDKVKLKSKEGLDELKQQHENLYIPPVLYEIAGSVCTIRSIYDGFYSFEEMPTFWAELLIEGLAEDTHERLLESAADACKKVDEMMEARYQKAKTYYDGEQWSTEFECPEGYIFKDYCDYDTCVALKELGYNKPTLAYYNGFLSSRKLLYSVIDENDMPEDGVNIFDLSTNHNEYKDSKFIDAPTLYEAQKWLRENKNIQIEIPISFMDNGVWKFSFRIQTPEFYDRAIGEWDSYEEALSEGIKEAVKILKEK